MASAPTATPAATPLLAGTVASNRKKKLCCGSGFAECGSGVWTAGVHKVSLGDLTVEVSVPSTVPFGGACTNLSQ